MNTERGMSRRQILAAGAAVPASLLINKMGIAGASPVRTAAATTTNPADLTILELLPLLKRRKLSSTELVEACIARTEALDPTIKALKRQTFDVALAGAQAVDQARARSDLSGGWPASPSG